jgi:hypothetical protein
LDNTLLEEGFTYTRKEIWNLFNPKTNFPRGGNWSTGYATQNNYLIIFVNIGTSGRTGHDFPNKFIQHKRELIWYGKPNAHSQQPLFKKLFHGAVIPLVFVRWDNANAKFLHLGQPRINSYRDGVELSNKIKTIELSFIFENNSSSDPSPEGFIESKLEGARIEVTVNRYERDPALRLECIKHNGTICKVCGFDFEKVYGKLGRDYCHVHHIKPLSKLKKETLVDPKTDLIPLCANCHSMIHRRKETLRPEELKKLLIKPLIKLPLMYPHRTSNN